MGGKCSVLHLVRQFRRFLPQVQRPLKKVPFREKAIKTGGAVLIFLFCSQLPLYGIHSVTGADPLYWMRAILASSRGTVMELGVAPIITSGMVMQLLTGARIIKVDRKVPENLELLNSAQKLLAILIALGEAAAYVLSGMYGDVGLLGVGNAFLIIFQLFFATVVVICLDELLQKGHGLGSAISLFTATNICESILWKAVSPATINAGRGPEFEGAIICLVHNLVRGSTVINGVGQAFYRQHLPNLTNLLATIFIFLAVVYLQRFRLLFPVKSVYKRGEYESFPIKLFYTSSMPIVLQSSLVSSTYFISQFLFKKFSGNFVVNLLGKWKESEYSSSHSVPVGGLAYYMTAPSSFANMAADPFRALFYVVFMLSACSWFSKSWVSLSGSSPKEVAEQLKEQRLVFLGHREASSEKVLGRYIPTAAAFGGMCGGALTILADAMGALGSGTGILLAVTIIDQLLETLERENGKGFRVLGY